MAAIVGLDAKVQFSTNSGSTWTDFTERNEFSISINVDVAERKVFVATFADAWVSKSRTWMSWSGSLSGYYDDASNSIFNTVVAGNVVKLRFWDSRNGPTYWEGFAIMTSVEHSTNTDDYSTLSVDFEGTGPLTRGP